MSIDQPTHSSILQVTSCTICGEAHEIGQCIPIEENTQEFHYMGNQQRQGYTQGGFSGFQQGPYNQLSYPNFVRGPLLDDMRPFFGPCEVLGTHH